MALNNDKAQTVPTQVQAPKTAGGKKESEGRQEVHNRGAELLAQMSEEERQSLGSKSGTLHFVTLLGLASKKQQRRVAANENVNCSTPVGIRFKTTEDLEVPVIDPLKNRMTGIDPEQDISYRTVKAGETFDVNYYEYMFLIIRPEFSGLCHANGDDQGAYFSAKLPQYQQNKAKLPTPTINLKNGSVKAEILNVDQEGPNGWEVKPEFKEQFGAFLEKRKANRSSSKAKSSTPAPTVVSVALNDILLGKAKK